MWEVKTKYTVGDARPNWVRGMMPCQQYFMSYMVGGYVAVYLKMFNTYGSKQRIMSPIRPT